MRFAIFLTIFSAIVLVGIPPAPPATASEPVINAQETASQTAMQRFSGEDRFGTATAISANYAPGVGVVYVASGRDFPDALSAAPAAASLGGPLLLTEPTALPGGIRAEIVRLKPKLIVVAGGPAAVSETVFIELNTIAPTRRDAGADRYETSRVISQRAFLTGASTVYLASGADYPDALSASAAAGSRKAPVVLINGAATSIDAPTQGLVNSLGVRTVQIAGGSAVVSDGFANSLTARYGASSVTRLAGADRYATSREINKSAFAAGAPTAFFAVGTGFSDALAGAALAAREHAPLYVVPASCVPVDVIADMKSLGTTKRVLLGGTGVLQQGVADVTACAVPRPPLSQPFDSVVAVSSDFGMRVHPITGVRTLHAGTDYSRWGITGTPIRSIAAGKVVAKTTSYATTGAGNSITVAHAGGVQSLSMHMVQPSQLVLGADVSAGQIIGYVGKTGGVTGPHLHLEVRVDRVLVDPFQYLRGAPLARP